MANHSSGAASLPFLEALQTYRQTDQDGVMVLASRQAIDEAVDWIKAHLSETSATQRDEEIEASAGMVTRFQPAAAGPTNEAPEGFAYATSKELAKELGASDQKAEQFQTRVEYLANGGLQDAAPQAAKTVQPNLPATEPTVSAPSAIQRMVREVMVYANCPRCGANNENEAAKLCRPGNDDCPMCCEENWKDALQSVNNYFIMSQDEAYWQQECRIADLEARQVEAQRSATAPIPGAIKLAVFFHDTYERLATEYGYETKPETRIFNASSPNGKLMIAVCGELRRHLLTSPDRTGADHG